MSVKWSGKDASLWKVAREMSRKPNVRIGGIIPLRQAPHLWQPRLPLWLEIEGERRLFAHQRDGHAAVCRDVGIVGKQRLRVRLARHLGELCGRNPLLLQDAPDR